jgi:pyridoxamine 5'-phosphate oxidase
VVAIREITKDWILFFTQKRTRKVEEIKCNGKIALTFWLERHARETIIEGEASFLSEEQNAHYWDSYPHWAQVRFCSYAPTSGDAIQSKTILEHKRLEIEQASTNKLYLAPPTIVVFS